MRYFPSARRRRVSAVCLTAVIACGLGSISPLSATAEDLRDKQRRLEQQIDTRRHQIDEASDRAQAAQAGLERSQDRLADARAHLEAVQGRVAAAVERSERLAEELQQAEARLETARASLAAGRLAVVETRDEAVDTITSIYESTGDPRLQAFSSFLSAGSLDEIEREQQTASLIVDQQSDAYDDVQDAEESLAATTDDVRTYTELVATKEAQAERTVERLRTLRERAVGARDRVLTWVQDNREAKQRALAAQRADRRALAELREREAEVQRRIMAAARRAAAADTGYTGSVGGLLESPVSGAVTSPFGYRTHPIYGYYGLHDGTDFGVACGEGLRAVADGTVISSYYSEVYGNRLYVSLGNVNGKNLTAVYNHASGYTVGVGARVSRGQTIGYVGDTGWSTGCHLHFSILENGVAVDPMSYL